MGVVDGFGDGEEYGISMVRRRWWRVPGGRGERAVVSQRSEREEVVSYGSSSSGFDDRHPVCSLDFTSLSPFELSPFET